MPDRFQIDRIRAILAECPEDVEGLPVGGAGTGRFTSLAQQLARFLSREIEDGRADGIEGAFISHRFVRAHEFFSDASGSVRVSTLDSENAHTIFRCSTG